jgi:hypothetical protein
MCPSGSAGNDGLPNIPDGGRGVMKISDTCGWALLGGGVPAKILGGGIVVLKI